MFRHPSVQYGNDESSVHKISCGVQQVVDYRCRGQFNTLKAEKTAEIGILGLVVKRFAIIFIELSSRGALYAKVGLETERNGMGVTTFYTLSSRATTRVYGSFFIWVVERRGLSFLTITLPDITHKNSIAKHQGKLSCAVSHLPSGRLESSKAGC